MALIDIPALFGDSETQGLDTLPTAPGGTGSWAEIVFESLASFTGKTIIGPGLRGLWLNIQGRSDGEWTITGSWVGTGGSVSYNLAPYSAGYIGSAGATATWNASAHWRPIVGFHLWFIDYASGGNWQYRVDGGTYTNVVGTGVTALTGATSPKLTKFYVNTPVHSTVDVRAFDGSGNVNVCFVGIEPFYVDPRTAGLTGFMGHNFSVGGTRLHTTVAPVAGDPLACIRSVTLGLGGAVQTYPNMGIGMMHVNDYLYASVSQWDTDLRALYTAASPLGPVLFINAWETRPTTYNRSDQTAYRAQTKTTAAAIGASIFDHFDALAALGITDHAKYQNLGYLNVDLLHESSQGHLDLAPRAFWAIAKAFLATVNNTSARYSVNAKPAAKSYTASRSKRVVPARPALTPRPLKPSGVETVPPVFNRLTSQDTAAAGTTSATLTPPRTATVGCLLIAVVHSVGAGAGTNSTPSGWTLGVDVGSGTHDLTLFWKISDGTETGVTCNAGSATTTQAHYFEYYTLDHTVAVTTSSAANTFGATESSEVTGAAGIAMPDPRSLAIAAVGQNGTNGGSTTWLSGSVTLLAQSELVTAYSLPAVAGTYSDQGSWATVRAGLGLAAVFRPAT